MAIPAKKAPSAKETPKSSAEPKAIPTATAMTLNVKSSLEPVRATCHSNQGKTRRPTTSMSTTNIDTFPIVSASIFRMPSADFPASPFASPPNHPASGGRNTSTKTITKSSTTSQPTAMRPFTDSRTPRFSSALRSTTVLATERARPNTMPAPRFQPQNLETAIPSAVATVIWMMAPGKAIRRTAQRSSREKCSPTPNIRRITPISAS